MNWLAVILGLLIAAQPLQAGFCDMEATADAAPHAGMQHDSDQRASGHDCCQPPDSEESRDCNDMLQCAPCATALPAVPAMFPEVRYAGDPHRAGPDHGRLTPSHSVPPFRPPITIS
jgi:hypothetical protein